MDLEPALPALMEGLSDPDDLVRSWSAQAVGSVGAPGVAAVALLIHMLSSAHEGDRNGACIALGGMGPLARAALPALSVAFNDPSHNVRGFALRAMAAIESARR